MTNNTVNFKKSCGVLNSASLTRSWGPLCMLVFNL
uniref:Uncharacterized protein n=1 Tax=Anguilla anguilla TaxID=7936 RepID=A0A0E9S5T0_ANGAN